MPPWMETSAKPTGRRRGESGRRRRLQTDPRGGRDREGDGILRRYFRDIMGHSLLSCEEEEQLACRLVELEESEWCLCLSHPPAAVGAASLVVDRHPELRPALRFVHRYHRLFIDGHSRFTRDRRRRYQGLVERVVPRLRRVDPDRELLERIEAWIIEGRVEPAGPSPGQLRKSRDLVRVRDGLTGVVDERNALRDRFIRANLRLVVSVAKKHGGGTLSLADLIQEGNFGLMKAVQRFDPSRGYRFSTYASWWIRHAISRALSDKNRTVRLPVHLLEAHKRLQRTIAAFEQSSGRSPSDAELMRILGVNPRRLRTLQRQSAEPAYSLDRPVSESSQQNFVDMLVDHETPSPLEQVAFEDWRKELSRILDLIPHVEAQVLRWRFGVREDREYTLKEIGERYKLSRERIRQLQQQGLARLREHVRGMY